MKIEIDENIIKQLISQSQIDGVQKIVVGAVIRIDGKFLLLERVPSDFMGGLVELPSGTVGVDEDLLSALNREVLEETGLSIFSVLSYIGSFDYTSGSGKKTRQFNFLVETKPGEIKLEPTEHQSYHLVSKTDKEFNTLNISDSTKSILQL